MRIEPMTEDVLDDAAAFYATVFAEPPWSEPWTPGSARQRLS